jgi:hypothetical protein
MTTTKTLSIETKLLKLSKQKKFFFNFIKLLLFFIYLTILIVFKKKKKIKTLVKNFIKQNKIIKQIIK